MKELTRNSTIPVTITATLLNCTSWLYVKYTAVKKNNVTFTKKQSRFTSSIHTSSYSDFLHKIQDIEICKDVMLLWSWKSQQIVLFFKMSILGWKTTHPPIKWVLGVLPQKVKQLQHETGHSHPVPRLTSKGHFFWPMQGWEASK